MNALRRCYDMTQLVSSDFFMRELILPYQLGAIGKEPSETLAKHHICCPLIVNRAVWIKEYTMRRSDNDGQIFIHPTCPTENCDLLIML